MKIAHAIRLIVNVCIQPVIIIFVCVAVSSVVKKCCIGQNIFPLNTGGIGISCTVKKITACNFQLFCEIIAEIHTAGFSIHNATAPTLKTALGTIDIKIVARETRLVSVVRRSNEAELLWAIEKVYISTRLISLIGTIARSYSTEPP